MCSVSPKIPERLSLMQRTDGRSVKHPIVDPRTAPVCLITKDPQREYKDLIAAQGIKFITRVVDIRHLKGKWKPFEARRLLLKENGLFLADERVVPLLPALLGKIFFQAKKCVNSYSTSARPSYTPRIQTTHPRQHHA